jgi:hypothetical protein
VWAEGYKYPTPKKLVVANFNENNTLCLTDVIRLLPPAARTKIEDIGHGKLLQFKLHELCSRVLLCEFMSHGIVHEDDIEFPVGDTSIWITRKVVEDALPLPSGSIKELPH